MNVAEWHELQKRFGMSTRAFSPAKLRFMNRLLENGRHFKNPRALRRLVVMMSRKSFADGITTSNLFVLVGLYEISVERKAWDRQKQLCRRCRRWHLVPHFWGSLFGRAYMRFAARYLGNLARRQFPGRPGWNDYHMVRWFLTANDWDLSEIYDRATRVTGDPMVAATARWMVKSVRMRHKDFDAAIAALEEKHGVPVAAPTGSDFVFNAEFPPPPTAA